MKVHNITAILLPMLLLACQKEHPRPETYAVSEDDAILFSSSVIPVPKSDMTVARLQSEGFGVFAYYTGEDNFTKPSEAGGVVLDNRKVYWGQDYTHDYQVATDTWQWNQVRDDENNLMSAWIYYGANYYGTGNAAYKEYWPTNPNAMLSFFAYAPYESFKTSYSINDSDSTNPYGPSISYNPIGSNGTTTAVTQIMINNQEDLLWGTNSSGDPYRNFKRPANDTIDLRFRHALSKVKFTINTNGSPDNPTLAELNTFDNRRMNTADYYRTYYLIEYVRIEFEGLGASALYLNNTVSGKPSWAAIPEGQSRTFDLTGLLPNSVKYVKDANNSAGWENNQTNYATLIADNRFGNVAYNYGGNSTTTTTQNNARNAIANNTFYRGINATPLSVMDSADNYIYVIPGRMSLNIEVKFHKLTFYLHQMQSGTNRYRRTVCDYYDGDTPNTRTGWTRSGSLTTSFESGNKYEINISLSETDFMELKVVPQQWDLVESEYNFAEKENAPIQYLDYDSNYAEGMTHGKVIINNRLAHFSFKLGAGRYIFWQASLVGEYNFAFCDADGNFLMETYDTVENDVVVTRERPATTFRGSIDPDIVNHIYIKATNPTTTDSHEALLRIYGFDSYTASGDPGNSTVLLNLLSPKYRQEWPDVYEWTVVQNGNV